MTETVERKVNPNIIAGRMPVAIVHLIRFGDMKGDATKDIAVKFATTVGKIDDVRKNRNFTYVTEGTKFTQEQLDEGIEWLKRHPNYDEAGADDLVMALNAYEVASEEEAAEFAAARTAARGQPTRTKDGEIASGGGGNRRKKKAEAEEASDDSEAAEPSAEDLMD